jgi:hypothetical protein
MNKFDERFLKILTEAYFDENGSTWGKETLHSAVLLAETFNCYIDFAEETDNFTNISKETSINEPFKTALIKNLLFIYSILDKIGLDEVALYDALKNSLYHNNNHPSYTQFKESLLVDD